MAHCAFRVDCPHVLADVSGERMIRFVHRERFAVVIHGDIGAAAECYPNTGRRASAAREGVNNQFMEIELKTAAISAQGVALNDVELLSRLAMTIRMPCAAFVFSCA